MRLHLVGLGLAVCLANQCAGQAPAADVPGAVLGSRARRPDEGAIQGTPGSQFALQVNGPRNVVMGDIRSVSFFIDARGAPRQPFRVHLYQVDKASGIPGKDLLLQPLIVAAPTGGKWFDVDVSTYHIPAPPTGFFVAMEWIESAEKPSSGAVDEDHMLRPTFEFKKSLTWSYTVGVGWNQLTLTNSTGRCYNAMIRAEVEVRK